MLHFILGDSASVNESNSNTNKISRNDDIDYTPMDPISKLWSGNLQKSLIKYDSDIHLNQSSAKTIKGAGSNQMIRFMYLKKI